MSSNKTKSTLLVCISSSLQDQSMAALRFACYKAKESNCHVELISVIDTTDNSYQKLFTAGDMVKTNKRKEVEEYLKLLVEKAYELGQDSIAVNLKEGFIMEEIIKRIENDNKISMLILEANQNSPNKGKTLSSFAEQVANKILIPLVIIPNNIDDEHLEMLA